MKNLELTEVQKAKVTTAVDLLKQVIAEVKAKPLSGPAQDQFKTLQNGTTAIELVQWGNCLVKKQTKKGA